MQSSRGELQQMHVKCSNKICRKCVLFAILSSVYSTRDETNETSRTETPTSHCSVSSSQIRHSFSYEDVVPAPNLKRIDCGEAGLIV